LDPDENGDCWFKVYWIDIKSQQYKIHRISQSTRRIPFKLYSSAAILYIHIDNRLKGFLTAIHKMIDDTCILELQDIHITHFTNESSIIKILMPYCKGLLDWYKIPAI
jgi:hypothetical protein